MNISILFYIYTSEETIYYKPVILPIQYKLIKKINLKGLL